MGQEDLVPGITRTATADRAEDTAPQLGPQGVLLFDEGPQVGVAVEGVVLPVVRDQAGQGVTDHRVAQAIDADHPAEHLFGSEPEGALHRRRQAEQVTEGGQGDRVMNGREDTGHEQGCLQQG